MVRDRVARLVEAKRKLHPELRGAVSLEDLKTVCDREGIAVLHGPLPTAGAALNYQGRRVILIDGRRQARRETYVLAHELGHIWLHGEAEPVIYHMDEPWPNDPREDEAEAVATMLLQGW